MMTEQIRNKYNTLTPAEAKKLNRILVSRQPLRTASVLRKPRAPPIVVTNLDNELEKQLSQSTICDRFNGSSSLTRQASMRVGTTAASDDSRRHTVNYGTQRQGALASRLSLYSTGSTRSSSTAYQQQQQQQSGQPLLQQSQANQISPHESFTNLSLRSYSRDAPDCASSGRGGYDPTYRFQTMSVDLGNPIGQRADQQTTTSSNNRAYDTMRGRARYAPQRSNTLNYRFSDDSFASAKSDLSAKSSSVTPTKFNPISTSVSVRQQQQKQQHQHQPREPPRSASKASLSSSTYKVFQSPFANFKKLFRGIQKPFASGANQPSSQVQPTESQKERPAPIAYPLQYQQQQQQQRVRSLNDSSLSDSTISHNQLSLSYSKSQSPPACAPPPPPLGQLKSMSYLENSINYSNYDEFTRSRNERLLLTCPNSMKTAGDNAASAQPPPPPPVNLPPILRQFVAPQVSLHMSQANGQSSHVDNHQQQTTTTTTYDTVANDENGNSNWQMTSLPVYYERNLTTVFEETKQASCEMPAGATAAQFVNPATTALTAEEIYQRLKPPSSFDDPNSQQQQQVASEPSECCERASSIASSNSPALSSAGESVLEFHRQQPATPYRFSFAQPQPNLDQTSLGKTLGLPPRAPPLMMGAATQIAGTRNKTSEINRQDNNSSSSGNSSNYDEHLDELVMADFDRLRTYFLHLIKMIRLEGDEPSANTICRVSSK